MYKDFWKDLAKKWPICLLAPMDWYWDSAYRQTVKKIAPNTICVSEFYSADWLVHSKFLADSVLPHDKIENPLIIQIFWKDPEMFAKAAKIISQSKYNIAWIDINMWCPAKKVVRSWHGSSLMINTDTAYKIVEEMNKATKLPISVKTRRSFDWNQDLIAFWKWLEKAWAAMLTVHGRTMTQAYTWVADWDPIYELKNNLSIPVIWNWDCQNYSDWLKRMKNLDWFMIWRASFWNPWCFLQDWELRTENWDYFNINKENYVNWIYYPNLWEILNMMEFHAEKLVETKWERKWSLEIRKHLVQYLKWFPWVKLYRKALVTTESFENSKNIIKQIKEEFKQDLEKRPMLWEIEKEDL